MHEQLPGDDSYRRARIDPSDLSSDIVGVGCIQNSNETRQNMSNSPGLITFCFLNFAIKSWLHTTSHLTHFYSDCLPSKQ